MNLETDRLRLRWVTADDVPLMLAIWNDPAFVQHVGDRGLRTHEQALQALNEGIFRTYADHGYGAYRVALKDGDVAIGTCGLYRREDIDDPDIGFALLPDFCGKGLAYEAAVAVRDHAREILRLPRLGAIVSAGNQPSIRLIEKLGLRFEKMLRMNGEDEEACWYSIEWPDNQP